MTIGEYIKQKRQRNIRKINDDRRKKKMARKWTKESAEKYVKETKVKGLTYLSAMDFLKHHSTMRAII